MKPRTFLALALVAAVLLAACAHLRPPPPIALSGADSGKAIEMTVGQTLTVRLPWEPSTGYRWQPVAEPDARMLIVLDSGFQRPPAKSRSTPPGGAPAAGDASESGYAWWRLRATGAGTTSFGVRYVRPWEPDAEPTAKEFTITVDVKPAQKSVKPTAGPVKPPEKRKG